MISNRQLLLPYAAPYLAYVGIASLPATFLAPHYSYALRLILVPVIMIWGWRWYCSLKGPRSASGSFLVGTVAGLLGLVIWIALLAPFVQAEETAPWTPTGFALRLCSAVLLVPVFEELMMRGYVFRLSHQWHEARTAGDPEPLLTALDNRSINDVPPGAWSWPAVIVSTVAFTSGHAMAEWPAAVAYGLLMAWLWITRKDLIACITAHAVTNLGLALFVYTTGNWHFW